MTSVGGVIVLGVLSPGANACYWQQKEAADYVDGAGEGLYFYAKLACAASTGDMYPYGYLDLRPLSAKLVIYFYETKFSITDADGTIEYAYNSQYGYGGSGPLFISVYMTDTYYEVAVANTGNSTAQIATGTPTSSSWSLRHFYVGKPTTDSITANSYWYELHWAWSKLQWAPVLAIEDVELKLATRKYIRGY